MKLIEKQRIASKTIRRYDKPKTPYQRIMESLDIRDETKKKLAELIEALNPFVLRKAMEKRLKEIFQVCYEYKRRVTGPSVTFSYESTG